MTKYLCKNLITSCYENLDPSVKVLEHSDGQKITTNLDDFCKANNCELMSINSTPLNSGKTLLLIGIFKQKRKYTKKKKEDYEACQI